MPEGLHIGITIAGQKDLNDTIGRINAGTYSINDMATANKGLKSSMKELEVGTPVYKVMQTAVAETEKGLKQLHGELKYGSSAYGEYVQSVRTARTEKRMLRFAIMEVVGGLEGLKSAYLGITGASDTAAKHADAFTKGIQGAITASFGLKFGLEMLGMAANIAGPIAIAVGALTLLGSILQSDREDARKLAEEMKSTDEKINDLLLKTGKINTQQAINLHQANAVALRSQAGLVKTTKKEMVSTGKMVDSGGGEMVVGYEERTVEDTEGILKRNKLLLEAMEEEGKIADLRTKQSEAKKKYDEESLKLIEEYWKTYDEALLVQPEAHAKWQKQTIEDTKAMAELVNKFVPIPKVWKPTKVEKESLSKEMGYGGENLGYLAQDVLKAKDAGQEFTDSLGQGLLHATNTLAQGFTNSFKLGNSLPGQFAATMLSTVSEVGVKALIGKGLSLIPGFGFLSAIWPHAQGGWINEPVVGIGLHTGGVHTFGEQGPEHVANMNQMAMNARHGGDYDGTRMVVNALRSMQWQMRGLDMVAAYDRNLAVRNGRLF